MNDHAFSSALRELRTDLNHRNTWVALAGVSLVLGIAGPFETYAILSLAMRVFYWSLVVVSTYLIGSMISALVSTNLRAPVPAKLLASSLLIGATVTLLLSGINAVVFPVQQMDIAALWPQFAVVTAIAAVIEIASALFNHPLQTSKVPAILDRVPLDVRAPLVALSVEDHYVRVQTTKGSEMVLMRLSDAIKEAGDIGGLQVHRSHWVAIDAVTAAVRKGDGAILSMSHGNAIPVSRSNIAAIKQAGLLPKVANG